MHDVYLLLYLLAAVFFALAAFDVAVRRVNLIARARPDGVGAGAAHRHHPHRLTR